MPIELYFPQLNGGVEQGLNDAGIETFEGEFQQQIVRECTQSALDARFTAGGQVPIGLQIAASSKAPFNLSLADAFAAVLARAKKAELRTRYPEHKALEKEIKIGWLK